MAKGSLVDISAAASASAKISRDDVYRASVREAPSVAYSRFVRAMKWTLPITALFLIVLVVLWPQLNKNARDFSLGYAILQSAQSENPGMINPRFVGTDAQSRPFSVTAEVASSTSTDGSEIQMVLPKADLALGDGTWLVMHAANGVFHRDAKRLDLVGGVSLFHDSGYEINTQALDVNLGIGRATSVTPTEGHGPFGNLHSQGLDVINRGRVIIFTGKARLVMYPNAEDNS